MGGQRGPQTRVKTWTCTCRHCGKPFEAKRANGVCCPEDACRRADRRLFKKAARERGAPYAQPHAVARELKRAQGTDAGGER